MAKGKSGKLAALAVAAACLLGGCAKTEPVQESAVAEGQRPALELRECTAETDAGYYNLDIVFDNQANITYIDYAAQREIFLCEQPSCSHQTESCRSRIALDGTLAIPALFAVGDHLIFVQTGASETNPPNIMIANLDGSGRRQLAVFPENEVLSSALYTDESFLYLTADANEPETAESTKKILRVALDDGAVDELYSYPKNELTPYIAGAFGSKLVMASVQTEPGGAMFSEYRSFDVQTGAMESEALARFDIQEAGSFLDGESIYAIDYAGKTISMTNLVTGAVDETEYSAVYRELKSPAETGRAAVFPVDGEWLRIEIPAENPAQEGFYEMLLNVQSGEVRPFTLLKEYNQDVVTLLGRYGESYLVCRDWIVSGGADSQGMPRMEFAPQYAFIRAEDFIHSNAQYVPVYSDVHPSAWGESEFAR